MINNSETKNTLTIYVLLICMHVNLT